MGSAARHLESIDWHAWLELKEAAALLGASTGHLRRVCSGELVRRGLAMHTAPPSGGNARWWIHRSYDARLAPDQQARAARTDVDALQNATGKQRDLANQRRACVEAFESKLDEDPRPIRVWIKELLADLAEQFPDLVSGAKSKRITKRTLYRWRKQLGEPGGVANLIDERGGWRRSNASPEAWQFFNSIYLTENQITPAECWRQTQMYVDQHNANLGDDEQDKALQWCSRSRCYETIGNWSSKEQQMRNRHPRKWRSQYRTFIKQRLDRFAANECWVSDHKQLNFWVRFQGSLIRPWVTTWQDWRTRKIVGYCFSANPNTSTILAAMRHALTDHGADYGPPAFVILDNGKDYDAYVFHAQTKTQRKRRVVDKGSVDETMVGGIYADLGIEVSFSLPYNPNGKARQERWYRTVDEQFCKLFATYCGRSVDTKPEVLGAILKRGVQVPSMEHARLRFEKFVVGFNHNADNRMEGLDDEGEQLAPAEAMRRWCVDRRILRNPDALDLLLQHWYKPVTWTRNGITIAPYGIALHYNTDVNGAGPSPLRARFFAARKKDRETLFVSFDPHDLRTITVYDSKRRYAGKVAENQLGGLPRAVDNEQLRKLMRENRRYANALKVSTDGAMRELLSSQELLAESILSEPPQPPSEPVSLKPVQTAFDDQVKEVERDELRRAVGADADAMPRPSFRMSDWRFDTLPAGRIEPNSGARDGADFQNFTPIETEIDAADLDEAQDDDDAWSVFRLR